MGHKAVASKLAKKVIKTKINKKRYVGVKEHLAESDRDYIRYMSREEITDLIIENTTHGQRLARSLLNKWRVKMNPNEVTSVVGVALCEAANRFDPKRGVCFRTFLFYHLRGLLIKEIKRLIDESRITQLIPQGNTVDGTVIDQMVLGDWPIPVVENRNPEHLMQKREFSQICWDACSGLDELEKEVVTRHFVNDQSLVEIAKELGYCRCHISRVKSNALKVIQRNLSEKLPEHAGFAARISKLTSGKQVSVGVPKRYTGGRGRRKIFGDKKFEIAA